MGERDRKAEGDEDGDDDADLRVCVGSVYATREVTTSGFDLPDVLISKSCIPMDQPPTASNVYTMEATTEVVMRRIDRASGGRVL
jgi:hypothetical protein